MYNRDNVSKNAFLFIHPKQRTEKTLTKKECTQESYLFHEFLYCKHS